MGPGLPVSAKQTNCPMLQLLWSFKVLQYMSEVHHNSEKGFLALLLLKLENFIIYIFFQCFEEKCTKSKFELILVFASKLGKGD